MRSLSSSLVLSTGEHRLRRPPAGFDSTFTGRAPQGGFGSGGHQEIYCAYSNAQVLHHSGQQLHSHLTDELACGSHIDGEAFAQLHNLIVLGYRHRYLCSVCALGFSIPALLQMM